MGDLSRAIFVASIVFFLTGCTLPTLLPTSATVLAPPVEVTPTKGVAAASPTPSDCSRDQVLARLKADFPYPEFTLIYNSFQGLDILNIWFVDPEIDPKAQDADLAPNAILALRHATALSHRLGRKDPCIGRLFTTINPIVVDSNYNGWFSGNIRPADLPGTDDLTEAQIEALEDAFEIAYWRRNPPAPQGPAPAASCTWAEARVRIQRHFNPSRENVGFMLVIDENGVKIYAQWDSDAKLLGRDATQWWALQMASMLNVAMELPCLHPVPTALIVTVVDAEGAIELLGILPDPVLGPDDSFADLINDFRPFYILPELSPTP